MASELTPQVLDELKRAADRCARVEKNADEGNACWISNVYQWDDTTPKGVTWDGDKRLLAKYAPQLLARASEVERLREACKLVLGDVGHGGPASDYVSAYTVKKVRAALAQQEPPHA